MSAPAAFRTEQATERSSFLNDRSYPEVARGDQYPEVRTDHENPEVARNYPEVSDNKYSSLREKEVADLHGSRNDEYRVFGLRPWILIALIGVIAIAIAIAVGLAVGIPASKRNHENNDSATPLPAADASTGLIVTSSQTASQTVRQTTSQIASQTTSPTASSTLSLNLPSRGIKCPVNDTDIFTTFTNDDVNTPDKIKSQSLKYKIHCNKDYTQTGNVRDMFSITVDSLTACINRCSIFNLQLPVENQSFSSLCSGVTLVQNNCYIKRGLTEDAISNLQHGIGDSAILIWDDEIS